MESIENRLKAVIENVKNQISGSIGISIIDIDSGMALASLSMEPDFDLDIAAAYNAEVVKAKRKAMEALNLKGQEITEFIISLTTQIHIISFVNENYMMYFAADSKATNLAMVKAILNKSVPELKNILSEL